MSFHVVIPARLASTRLPGKVLRPIAGRPMIAHVCRAALASQAASVWVATDDETVAAAAREAGAEVVMTRADHLCGSDRIAEAVGHLEYDNDALVVNVQADEPMMPSALIDQVGAALADDASADIATACTPITTLAEWQDPGVVKVVSVAGRALYFSRAAIPYDRGAQGARFDDGRRHLGIYAYRVGALKVFAAAPPGHLEQLESLEQLRAFELGMTLRVVEACALPGPGVDTEADLIDVEQRMVAR